MEAIGRLAGGIAHDFNNILTVISGNAQLGLITLKEEDLLHDRLQTIHKAAEHASELTNHLLAFSRRQIISPRILDLNEIFSGLEPMLRRVIGEDIEFTIRPAEKLSLVEVDPTQFEQVLVNLVVNARDAMPGGGSLTIETADVEMGEEYVQTHSYITTGKYVQAKVTDSGTGMSEEVQRHIFEPFFTTKSLGSGLGLAMVYGIVKQSGGSIEVHSEEGAGTTFEIYLPVADEPAEAFVRKREQPELAPGSETILLVEDEEGVRSLAAEILGELGYTVHDFANPEEVLTFCESFEGDVDLLLTDVIMPGASGAELAGRMQSYYPSARVLYMSGYTDDFIVRHGELGEGVAFLRKPFSPQALANKVRDVLGSDQQ